MTVTYKAQDLNYVSAVEQRDSLAMALWCDDRSRRDSLAIDISAITGISVLPDAPQTADDLTGVDAVYMYMSGFDQTSPELLSHLVKLPQTLRPKIIIDVTMEQLDNIYGVANALGAQILVAGSKAERLLTLIRLVDGETLREDEKLTVQRLKQIQDEIALIAKRLDDLTDLSHVDAQGYSTRSDQSSDTLRNPALDFRAPDDDYSAGLVSPENNPPVSAKTVRAYIKRRRMREQFFEAELFADPAWDMLLDLYAANLEGVAVSVSSLCIASAVPPTTALRWIELMKKKGLFARRADPTDKRRIFITLTNESRQAMTRYFVAMKPR